MAKTLKMPLIGKGIKESVIVQWFIEEGNDVKINDPIVEVEKGETKEKILSPYSGKVLKILEASGETISAGSPILEYDDTQPIGNQVEEMTPIRQAISNAMVMQHTNIPCVTNFDQVEVSKLIAHRKSFKLVAEGQGIKLTYLSYVAKALAMTALKFPDINASVKGTETVYHNTVNVGIAVSATNGLYVPVIKEADNKTVLEIAKEIFDLAALVRAGAIKMKQMQGATITISNLGSVGGGWFTPIINGTDVIILGLGSISKELILNSNGERVEGQNMKLSMTYDHRLVDGMLAQLALNYLKNLLSEPELILK